jgi:hypothetical protein
MCVHAQQHFFQLSSLFVFSVCEFVYLLLCLFFVCLCVFRSKDQNHKPYMYIRDINSNATRTEQTVSLVCVTRIPTSLTPPRPQSQCLKALTCRPASHAARAVHTVATLQDCLSFYTRGAQRHITQRVASKRPRPKLIRNRTPTWPNTSTNSNQYPATRTESPPHTHPILPC